MHFKSDEAVGRSKSTSLRPLVMFVSDSFHSCEDMLTHSFPEQILAFLNTLTFG